MVKSSKAWCRYLALSIFTVAVFYLPASTVDARLATSSTKTYVYDVKSSGLNIRSGAGTSYPIIGQVGQGSDLVQYCPNGSNNCSANSIIADSNYWERVYYSNPSLGYYANSALGWSAWYNTSGTRVFNYQYTQKAVSRSSTSIYSSDCSNLSGVVKSIPSDYHMNSFDSELMASPCNPNAWRMYDFQGSTDSQGYKPSGFVNGWLLRAE